MKINTPTTLCFTGHRTGKLPKTTEALEALNQALYQAIDKAVGQGVDPFLIGACYGFDLMAAMCVGERSRVIKPTDPDKIKLIAVVPFEGQANRWKAQDRALYFKLLPLCDEVITLNTRYKNGCYYDRNRWLVDNSSQMICYYDGSKSGTGYTVAYARRAKLPILNLY